MWSGDFGPTVAGGFIGRVLFAFFFFFAAEEKGVRALGVMDTHGEYSTAFSIFGLKALKIYVLKVGEHAFCQWRRRRSVVHRCRWTGSESINLD